MSQSSPPAAGLLAVEGALRAALAPQLAARDTIVTAAEQYLRAAFPAMVGREQLWAHYHPGLGRTTDPLEHSLEVLAGIDVDGLIPRDQRGLLWAALFHDVGKALDPYARDHARASAELAAEPLRRLEDDEALRPDILLLVATHDLLGYFLQGRLSGPQLLSALLGDERALELHVRLAGADILSIRGLRDLVTPERLVAAHAELKRLLPLARGVG